MNEEKPTLTWEQIKGITRGQILDLEGRTINPENYSNVAQLGNSIYILASSMPEGIGDQLEDREEIRGQQYGNLNTALELAGKGETDEIFLYQEKGIEEILSEKARVIPTSIEQQIIYGLELTLAEVEKRYFENAPEQYLAGRILIEQTLDQKFNAYIIRRKQQQFEKEKDKLNKRESSGEITKLEKRERLAQYLKDKLFDINILSFQELKNIEQFSFENLDERRRQIFLDKVKNNYNRLQQYADEFLDLLYNIVVTDATANIQQKALEHISQQEQSPQYQAEKQLIEQGLLARLFMQTLTEEDFKARYKKTSQEMQEDVGRRKTPFQRRLGKEILDKFIAVDLEEKEEQPTLTDAGRTKHSIRKAYLFGDETDELGVIRHDLSAKDIVNISEIFDQAQKSLQPRIELIKSSTLFEDTYLNSLKAGWLYTNSAIIEWKNKIRQKQKELNNQQTDGISTKLNKLIKKLMDGTATDSDRKQLQQLQRTTMNVAGRDKMIDDDMVGKFDQKRRNELMKELQEDKND